MHNFRNSTESFISFHPGLNVIWGDNAQGKTNLLEAISLISTGRSFRTQHLSELIKEGKSFFYIEAEVVRDNATLVIKISFDGIARKLTLNASKYSTFSPLLGTLPSVFAFPDDINLIMDSPAVRRHFINLHLAQSDPLYVHHLARFWRAMKQRNRLLKSKTVESIECWETEMAISAQYLFKMRKELMDLLKEPLLKQGKFLSSENDLTEMNFHPSYAPEIGSYLQQLKKSRVKEKELGFTLHGPHRDDLSFSISAKNAKTFASEGQKKTLVTALRLSQWEHLYDQTGVKPFMAIDDFGGALDPSRQEHLANHLKSLGQVFLTMPAVCQIFTKEHLIPIQSCQIPT